MWIIRRVVRTLVNVNSVFNDAAKHLIKHQAPLIFPLKDAKDFAHAFRYEGGFTTIWEYWPRAGAARRIAQRFN
jgi:hypothetical protein